MGRRWLGVEISRETVNDFAVPRLEKVIAGVDKGGVTDLVQLGIDTLVL